MLLFQDNEVFSYSEDFALLLCQLIFICLCYFPISQPSHFFFLFFFRPFHSGSELDVFNLITAPARGASDTINSILQKTDWSIPSHRTEYDRQIEQFNPQGRFGYL